MVAFARDKRGLFHVGEAREQHAGGAGDGDGDVVIEAER